MDIDFSKLPNNYQTLSWHERQAIHYMVADRNSAYGIPNPRQWAHVITAESQSIPELHQAMSEVCQILGVSPPLKLIIVDQKSPNAALVACRDVIITTGFLKKLYQYTKGALAHEVGHYVDIKQNFNRRDLLRAMVISGVTVATCAAIYRGDPLSDNLSAPPDTINRCLNATNRYFLYTVPVLALMLCLVNKTIRHTREYEADGYSAQVTGTALAIEELKALETEHKKFIKEIIEPKLLSLTSRVAGEATARCVTKHLIDTLEWIRNNLSMMVSHPSTNQRIMALERDARLNAEPDQRAERAL